MSATLYLGLDPKNFISPNRIVHYPIIRVLPLPFCAMYFDPFTHWIFTSQTAVRILSSHLKRCSQVIAIGRATAACLKDYGVMPQFVAKQETQEGIIALLEKEKFQDPHFLWPRSKKARPMLANWMALQKWKLTEWPIYDIKVNRMEPLPNLKEFEEIVFSSPSTVDAFLEIFGDWPTHAHLTTIGPVTREHLAIKMQILKNPRNLSDN